MDKKRKLIKFIEKNPPIVLPGDSLYWIELYSGEIQEDPNSVSTIKITEDFKWEYESFEDEFVPNSENYFYTSRREAKKARNRLGDIQYAVFKHDEYGKFSDGEFRYSFAEIRSFPAKDMDTEDLYIQHIIKKDLKLKEGELIVTYVEGRDQFIKTSDYYEEAYTIRGVDEEANEFLKEVLKKIYKELK